MFWRGAARNPASKRVLALPLGMTGFCLCGLRSGAEDRQIWDYGRAQGFTIVSKDTDFRERSFVEGFPPKVIWLDVGDAGATLIADLLSRERQRVEAFENQDETS